MKDTLDIISYIDDAILESRINVLDAMIAECDKIETLKEECFCEGYSIFQEADEPEKEESTLSKVLLAIPRFIAMLFKAIKDGIKKCVDMIKTDKEPKLTELASTKEGISLGTGVKVMIAGGIAGAGIAAYSKHKVGEIKKHRKHVERNSHEVTKAEINANINRIIAIKINGDGDSSILIKTSFKDIMNAVVTYWHSIMEGLKDVCGVYAKNHPITEFESKLKDLVFSAKNPNNDILKSFLPNWDEELGQSDGPFVDKETFKSMTEYRNAISQFSEKSFVDRFTKYGDKILEYIVAAYKSYELDKDKANSAENIEKYRKKAGPYAIQILEGLKEMFNFLMAYLQKMTKLVADSFRELSELENKAKLKTTKKESEA